MIKRLASRLTKKTDENKKKETAMDVKQTKSTSTKTKKTTRKNINSDVLSALIAKKAYEFYENRGYQHGNDQVDWYEAEKSVLASLKK